MQTLIVLGLATIAYCQFLQGGFFNFGSDRIHGYSFEYHEKQNILLVRNQTACFIADVDSTIQDDMKHRASREKIEDDLYLQIKHNQGETVSSVDELRKDIHDNRAVFECFRHDVFKIQYIKS